MLLHKNRFLHGPQQDTGPHARAVKHGSPGPKGMFRLAIFFSEFYLAQRRQRNADQKKYASKTQVQIKVTKMVTDPERGNLNGIVAALRVDEHDQRA